MLYRLSRGDETRIQRWRTLVVFQNRFAFFEDADDGVASLPLRAPSNDLENLFEALDLAFGFGPMLFECRFQFLRLGTLGHLG